MQSGHDCNYNVVIYVCNCLLIQYIYSVAVPAKGEWEFWKKWKSTSVPNISNVSLNLKHPELTCISFGQVKKTYCCFWPANVFVQVSKYGCNSKTSAFDESVSSLTSAHYWESLKLTYISLRCWLVGGKKKNKLMELYQEFYNGLIWMSQLWRCK